MFLDSNNLSYLFYKNITLVNECYFSVGGTSDGEVDSDKEDEEKNDRDKIDEKENSEINSSKGT